MNDSTVSAFLAQYKDGPGWVDKCIRNLNHSANIKQVADGLVGKNGLKPVTDVAGIWGIDLETCSRFCGREVLPRAFSFGIFISGSTNYLLPWLGLCAQLPYETGSAAGNLMSLCLALGSPMLITFSLMSTILNGHLASRSIRSLLSRSDHHFSSAPHHSRLSDQKLYKRYKKRLAAVYSFLLDAQQVPLRAVQLKGQFSSLLVLPENHRWWQNLRARLEATRRPVTFSLVAQVLFGVIAWILTVAGAYSESLGDSVQALLLSSGSLWLWLVPIILGWIFVGTQSTSGTIDRALKAEKVRNAPLPGTEDKPYPGQQSGVAIKSGLTLWLQPHPTMVGDLDPAVDREGPTWAGGSVYGDESREGPIFNYARVFTWFGLLRTTEKAFDEIFKNIEKGNTENLADRRRWGQRIDDSDSGGEESKGPGEGAKASVDGEAKELQDHPSTTTQVLSARTDSLLSPPSKARLSDADTTSRSRSPSSGSRQPAAESPGTSDKIASYSGLSSSKAIKAYPKWTELPSAWWNNMLWSTILAIFVQWGTAGAAIIISWLTEVKGLGCRSASYMLYGALGTLSFVLLMASAGLSHQAMLLYQRELFRSAVSNSKGEVNTSRSRGRKGRRKVQYTFTVHRTDSLYTQPRSKRHTLVCALAVLTRSAGKGIAVLNAAWIVISSLFELVGFYDSCWCTGTVLWLGKRGWVVLFKTAIELREEAEPSWAGGITLSMLVGFISLAVFFVWSSAGKRIRKGRFG